jgi:hypothetical protein
MTTETPRLVLAYRAILAEAERLPDEKKGGPCAEPAANQETTRVATRHIRE